MDDTRSPSDAESRPEGRKGDAARRTAFRLRDAELVATTRRDMFGDGSLLDALGGHPLPREKTEADLAADAMVSVEPAAPQPADPEVADEPPRTETPLAPAIPGTQAGAPDAGPAQSLDAIIDSFPADPAPTAPEPLHVSAIFEGLGSAAAPARERYPQEERGGDASLEDNDSTGAQSRDATATRQPAAGTARLGVPLFFQLRAGAPEPKPADWPPRAAPGAEAASGSDTGELPEPFSSALRQNAAPTDPAPYPQPADWPPPAANAEARAQAASLGQAREGGMERLPEPLAWPTFPEAPGYQAADADAPPLEPPSLVGRSEPAGGASPFPAPPAWPPFPGPHGAEAGLSASAPAGLPPYIELPAHPEREEEQAASSVPPAFTDPEPPGSARSFEPTPASFEEATPIEAPPFHASRGLTAFADRRPERRDMPRFPDFETSPPPLDAADATSKIAAEANATAQVLDNLQRLLDRTVAPPQPQQAYPQAPQPRHLHSAPFHPLQDEPMPFAREMAPMLPLPLPPSERAGSKNVYLLGFLTGLMLSVMAGAALYFLINTG